jgi:hypothetical protein
LAIALLQSENPGILTANVATEAVRGSLVSFVGAFRRFSESNAAPVVQAADIVRALVRLRDSRNCDVLSAAGIYKDDDQGEGGPAQEYAALLYVISAACLNTARPFFVAARASFNDHSGEAE